MIYWIVKPAHGWVLSTWSRWGGPRIRQLGRWLSPSGAHVFGQIPIIRITQRLHRLTRWLRRTTLRKPTSGTQYYSCGQITITRIIQGLHLLTRWRRLTTLKKNMIKIYLASCSQVYTWSNSDFKNKSRWLRLTAFKQARKPRSYASPKLCRLTYWHG